MDHKVSKDMISSGMIPSGEKTQADLGRTQYGSAPSPSSLMDAYKSIYEHHQKDKDGNTIPHEEEQVDEAIAGLAARGLMGAARGARVAGKLAAQGAVRARQMQASGGFRKVAGAAAQKAGQAAKGVLSKPGVKGGLVSGGLAGAATGAMVAGAMGGGKKKETNNRGLVPTRGYSSYDMNFDYTPEGDLISEDLFDALKSALIEEGCDEKNAMKIMASVTPDYFNEIIEEENLDEVVFTGSAMLAGLAAKKLLGAAALKGLKTGATMLAKKAAVKTMGMGSRGVLKTIAKKGVGAGMDKAAGTAIKGGLKSAVKNPVNTAMVATMAPGMMGGGGAQPQAAQRLATSGKRTAGMQRMDLDLFDVVKGQLLDEGLTEEECSDVMTTLTLEEINETLQLDEISGKLAMKASRAADMKRAQLAKAGDKVGAAKKAAQATRLYQGGAKRNLAKQDLSKPLNPQRKDYPMGKGASYQQKPGM